MKGENRGPRVPPGADAMPALYTEFPGFNEDTKMDMSLGAELSSENVEVWLKRTKAYLRILALRKKDRFDRRVSLGDLLTERDDNAAAYGFGEGTTMYDNVLVLGDVRVGRNCWIGPGCILDGSGGGLEIGDWCSISAGVQIYTHHTVKRSISLGRLPVDVAPTRIGSGVYIGPNAIVQMGVIIGDKAIIGANSLVNRNVPAGASAYGSPARLQSSINAPSSPSPPDPTAAWSNRTGRSVPAS